MSEIQYGEIIAWRVWDREGDALKSISFTHYEWTPENNEIYNWQEVTLHGNAGFYAKKHWWGHLLIYLGVMPRAVLGRVALWGEVVECKRGYRAQYARVVSLNAGCLWWGTRKLRERYGVKGFYLPIPPLIWVATFLWVFPLLGIVLHAIYDLLN